MLLENLGVGPKEHCRFPCCLNCSPEWTAFVARATNLMLELQHRLTTLKINDGHESELLAGEGFL